MKLFFFFSLRIIILFSMRAHRIHMQPQMLIGWRFQATERVEVQWDNSFYSHTLHVVLLSLNIFIYDVY